MENELRKLFCFEQKWLGSGHGSLFEFYCRYVDTIFLSFSKWASSSDFRPSFKQSTPKLKFHYRKGTYEKTPIFGCFQQLFTQINSQRLATLYRMKIVLVRFAYKKIFIKTLIDGIFCLNKTWNGFHLDLENLNVILQKINTYLS